MYCPQAVQGLLCFQDDIHSRRTWRHLRDLAQDVVCILHRETHVYHVKHFGHSHSRRFRSIWGREHLSFKGIQVKLSSRMRVYEELG